MIDLFIEVEDDVPHGLVIHLVITGEFCDHGVVGTKHTLHHPLALEDLLLQRLGLVLHASHLLGPLNIPDVEHPLMHLDGLRVLHHVRQVWVDYPFEELVLGGARSAMAI